jgi:hypothetical protein
MSIEYSSNFIESINNEFKVNGFKTKLFTDGCRVKFEYEYLIHNATYIRVYIHDIINGKFMVNVRSNYITHDKSYFHDTDASITYVDFQTAFDDIISLVRVFTCNDSDNAARIISEHMYY